MPGMQGGLSMKTAVLSPENIAGLMQINLEQRHTQLESMYSDDSSNCDEHWQQVAVRYSPICS